jgi:hypothetical protein
VEASSNLWNVQKKCSETAGEQSVREDPMSMMRRIIVAAQPHLDEFGHPMAREVARFKPIVVQAKIQVGP